MESCRPRFASIVALAVASWSCAQQADDGSSATSSADVASSAMVAVVHGAPMNHLDASFTGFSYEKKALATPLFTPDNAALSALFTQVGPSVLRVGGNTVDTTRWVPTGAGGTVSEIAPADVDRLAGFLRATGWRVIYGLNLATSTPEGAADEAAYAAHALGDSLLGFEIGNEPDLYFKGARPPTYRYADFRSEWEAYANAIVAAVPNAPLTGPAIAMVKSVPTWTAAFANDEADRITLLTQHHYVADGMAPTSTIDKLLLPDPTLAPELASLGSAASGARLPGGFRLAETNSYYNGGAPNVSDSYASALWVIDFLFAVAEAGASGVNLHGGGNGPGYTPIATDGHGRVVEARPEYAGVLLFSRAARGDLVQANVNGPPTLSAHAVDEPDGATDVVLVNKDSASTVSVSIDLGREPTAASVLTLAGPALAATTGVTLGGAPIGADGSWTPTEIAASSKDGRVEWLLPPASAVRIHITTK